MKKNFLVGFYIVNGVPDSVETPIIGNPKAERAKLGTLIKARHPTVKDADIIPGGSVVEARDESDPGYIVTFSGQTIRQLFIGNKGEDLASRRIGSVFFSGAPFVVEAVFSRGSTRIRLLPRLRNDSIVSFSNSINPQRAVTELPALVTEILEPRNIKELTFRFRNP